MTPRLLLAFAVFANIPLAGALALRRSLQPTPATFGDAFNKSSRRELLTVGVSSFAWLRVAAPSGARDTKDRNEGYKLQHSEKFWRTELSPSQYNILREGEVLEGRAIAHGTKLLAERTANNCCTFLPVRAPKTYNHNKSTDSFIVLFLGGTEKPFSSPLEKEKREGTFVCAGCRTPLFLSSAKVRTSSHK